MLKKSITYTDLLGNEVTEDHYFHLSKADLVEMEMAHKGGLASYLQQIVASEDGAQIIEQFKRLILRSYGVKSDDGRRFIKTPELRDEFLTSEAYSALFIQLCTDADAAADFVNGIVPKDMSEARGTLPLPEGRPLATETEVKATTGRNVFESPGELDPTATEPKLLTREELTAMDDAELRSGLAEGRYRLS